MEITEQIKTAEFGDKFTTADGATALFIRLLDALEEVGKELDYLEQLPF